MLLMTENNYRKQLKTFGPFTLMRLLTQTDCQGWVFPFYLILFFICFNLIQKNIDFRKFSKENKY